MSHPTRRQLGDTPQAAVHRDDDVDGSQVRGLVVEQHAERVVVVGVGVNMSDLAWCLRALVQPAVHDRDVVAPVDEGANEGDTGGPGPTYHHRAFHEIERYPGVDGGHAKSAAIASSATRVFSSQSAPAIPARNASRPDNPSLAAVS